MLQVYDPTRRTVMAEDETEVLGEFDGWRPARYGGEGGPGEWFAFRLRDNTSCLMHEVPSGLQESLRGAVRTYAVEERLLKTCELVEMLEVTPSCSLDEALEDADQDSAVRLAVSAARRAGYSDGLIAEALTNFRVEESLLIEEVLKTVDTINLSQIEELE